MASPYRLGLDLGTNSIGWSILDLRQPYDPAVTGEPVALRDLGVRIFPDGRDPQSKMPLAVDRRIARGMRRRRDRYLLRRKELMAALVRHGLMPPDRAARKALETDDPYVLRARGLDEALTGAEFGRALFHLSQRRGFRSNRKSDGGDDKEAGLVKSGVATLEKAIDAAGARTLGEYLHSIHGTGASVRARLAGEGKEAAYVLYPARAMIEREFDALWAAQASYHPDLTEAARNEIRRIMFRQRPLRPVDPGKCALDPAKGADDLGGFRAPRALPLAQRFRIYQELANLTVERTGAGGRRLRIAERNRLADLLLGRQKLSFDRMRRELDLSEDERFNLESARRAELKGDETAAALAHKDRFGKAWRNLAVERQTEIVERLLSEEDEGALTDWLVAECGLDEPAATKVSAARLPQGHARLGRRALAKIVPLLETKPEVDPATGEIYDAPVRYAEAAFLAGYHHSDRRPDERLPRLPYYGVALERHVSGTGDPRQPLEQRVGRIANPTVHIALNQLRRLVNAIVEEHGPPAEIVVEVARDLKRGLEEKRRIEREQTENQRLNDERRKVLAALGIDDSYENRLRLRLWEELNPGDPLDRRCVYTGEQISQARLFAPDVEVEHILPFRRTLDDSPANKTLSLRHANRAKGNDSPHEAFGEGPTIQGYAYDWQAIAARANCFPPNKRWRFGEDAMERYENQERDFLDRQLTDTAYLARASKQYLGHVCNPDKVWVTPGRLTALLRGKWGLNALLPGHNWAADEKQRTDHRHHAVDAFVIGVSDRAMLKRVSDAADETRERVIDEMPEPWNGFRDELAAALEGLIVSHRPDHGAQGKLHEETAYGLVRDPAAEDGHNLVYRKGFLDLNANEIARIRDPRFREAVMAALGGLERAKKMSAKELKAALTAFNAKLATAGKRPARRVRLLKKEADLIEIRDRAGRIYKAYSPGDNHRVEIYETADGSWRGEAVTMFQANRPGHISAWRRDHPDARFVMRVHKGDLLRLDRDGVDVVMQVVRLNAMANRLYLAGHRDAGNLQNRHADPNDPFRWFLASYAKLKECGAHRIHVDALGRAGSSGVDK